MDKTEPRAAIKYIVRKGCKASEIHKYVQDT